MTVRSYAKINLGLRILGKRPDGFHTLQTIFHRVNLYDTIRLERTDGGVTLESNRSDIPRDRSNLCVRAAEMLLRGSSGEGVHIDLQKRIPAGAGLGGGSSNAASVLRALPRLLGMDIPEEEVQEIAAMLGSDVPFFLHDGSAKAGGRGEILEYFPYSCPWWIVLVIPDVHVSTAWAYARLRLRLRAQPELPDLRTALLRAEDHADALNLVMHNDFEGPVLEAFPVIGQIKERLREGGARGVLMSGSGSAVFGLFDDEQAALRSESDFPAHYVTALTAPGFSPDHLLRDA
ncbi:MAG: 4-(cytidine 5'-diphospho)-2-C-methyl-D-erythritol kinase [Bacteroidetes bacterium]|nr:4-(cytidine 5'-diphospho)-2-C-methyl-D-erythritol kinase [Bacteroidota bacterium]